jgi:leader peptidase (prepilin peptidase)/N-methyltransferase
MNPETFLWLVAGLLGATIGSFLNVCVSRWPNDESVVSPRSRCPRCGRPIRWYENVPVLSWIALRAKCAGCGLPISWQYPLVEIAVAAIWVLCVWAAGPTILALRTAVFFTLLLGVALTDAQSYTIPDGFTVTGLITALAGALYGTMNGEVGPYAGLIDAVIGACAGAGVIAIAGWLGEVALKREAMGFGDVTLMAMIGAHLGPTRALLTVVAGAMIGLVAIFTIVLPITLLRRRGAPAVVEPTPSEPPDSSADENDGDIPGPGWLGLPPIPFGVSLAPAGAAVLIWGDAFVRWYLSITLAS